MVSQKKNQNEIVPEKGFYFQADKHIYWLDGKRMTGVTTILNSVLAKPALISWASNMAVDYVKEHAKPSIDLHYDYTQLLAILEEARTAYAKKRDKAADTGTLAHAEVEKYIKTGNWTPTGTKQIDDMVMLFIVWAQKEKVKFLESEKVVWSKKYFYGGKFDFLCEINGKIYLGDYKTGNSIYKEMQFQTAAYRLALEECEPETKVDGSIIVNTTKDGKFNVEMFFDYEGAKDGFLACLKLYRLLNQEL